VKLRNNEQQKSIYWTKSLIIEEATEKILQFVYPAKSMYNKNFSFNQDFLWVLINKNVTFEHYKKFNH
jgi:hypothetical protein